MESTANLVSYQPQNGFPPSVFEGLGSTYTATDFIKNFYCIAVKVEKKYGVPRLVCLGQGSMESANGNAAPGNNYFGIKAFSNWKGKTQVFTTTDLINGQYVVQKQTFRAYDTPEESFLDYGNYLRNSGLYNAAFQYSNPYDFIQKVGAIYATVYYANAVSGRMKTIAGIIQKEKISCGGSLGVPLLILGVTALGVGVAYKFDGQKIKQDLQELINQLK